MADLLSPTRLPIAHPTATVDGFSAAQIDAEAERLAKAINDPQLWGLEMCRMIAPLTLRINQLKQEQGVFLMAHSYQTPDIVYGVADAVGDSYGLAKKAAESDAETILFSSVRFMAETAKIVNPTKRVLHPSPEAGCSLADGITAADVRQLKQQHPGVPVVCYINTTAEVKAECDVSVTSSNYLDICRNLPGDEIVFVPDRPAGQVRKLYQRLGVKDEDYLDLLDELGLVFMDEQLQVNEKCRDDPNLDRKLSLVELYLDQFRPFAFTEIHIRQHLL